MKRVLNILGFNQNVSKRVVYGSNNSEIDNNKLATQENIVVLEDLKQNQTNASEHTDAFFFKLLF